ncbi:MAG: tRNA pseudouridine(38-40) synthase TruA [Chloroflexi bacterium]|nr:MAG: tRNA pseudouridine(38-40) synthase TruA [Chloroflexota bacterium]
MNVKLVIEYEGTRYHGWQAQAGAPTVEAALRDAIQSLTGESPVLTAAGRTDAGVHALGQVVNFRLEREFPIAQMPGALNARLAPDIAVRRAEVVDESFNARYSAKARLYAYRIRQALPRGAYQRQYAWGLHDTLDAGGHTIRQVREVTVSGTGDWVTIAVAADAFLYGMVRRIAGALVEVGRRRQPVEWIDSLLGGSTTGLRLAPPQGLVQVAVEY